MKKLLIFLALIATTPAAHAGVSCSLPFNLQNNTVADATQVMANYNALLACFGNAAKSGVNSDITALTALNTPITPTQGGTPVYVGGTSTGSANSQIIGSTTPVSFALTAGNQVTFYAGFTNTGPLQINVSGTGLTNVFRRTQLGISATVGGEVIAGHAVTVLYDGIQFQITSIAPVVVGQIVDFGGATAPPGWAFIDGSCQTRTGIWADLFSVISTNFGGGCDGAHFGLPDGRGRMLAGQDNMGGSAAGRMTSAGGSCNGLAIGTGCGTQSITIARDGLPADALTVTGTTSGYGPTISAASAMGVAAGTSPNLVAGLGAGAAYGPNQFAAISGFSSLSVSGTTSLLGNGNPTHDLSPLQIVTKIIKY